MSYATFQARVLPRLMAPAAPFGRSPFERRQGGGPSLRPLQGGPTLVAVHDAELARALARAADVDVRLKNSAPLLETLSAYVGGADRGQLKRFPEDRVVRALGTNAGDGAASCGRRPVFVEGLDV